jgi:hypothetical protein
VVVVVDVVVVVVVVVNALVAVAEYVASSAARPSRGTTAFQWL